MTKSSSTEIVVILDKSGSMGWIRNDAIGGFNTFIQDQRKEEGEATVTVVLFDYKPFVIASGVDIDKVDLLTEETYRPSGGTALYDAIGKAISDFEYRLKDTPEDERPEQVVVAILTDGAENASTEYSDMQIQAMIKDKTDNAGWQFLFLAANIDAKAAAKSIGIDGQFAMNFNVGEMIGTYDTLSRSVSQYRASGKIDDISAINSSTSTGEGQVVWDTEKQELKVINNKS